MESTTIIETALEIEELDLLPLQYYIDFIINSVKNCVSMISGFFSRLPQWVLICYGIAVSLALLFFMINKFSGH